MYGQMLILLRWVGLGVLAGLGVRLVAFLAAASAIGALGQASSAVMTHWPLPPRSRSLTLLAPPRHSPSR
jgi:hypothetical protein